MQSMVSPYTHTTSRSVLTHRHRYLAKNLPTLRELVVSRTIHRFSISANARHHRQLCGGCGVQQSCSKLEHGQPGMFDECLPDDQCSRQQSYDPTITGELFTLST